MLNPFRYPFCQTEPTCTGIWHYVTAETYGGQPPVPRYTSSIQRGVQEMFGIYYMVGHSTLELQSKPLAIAPGKLFAHLEGETRQCQVRRFTAYQLTSHTTCNPDCWHRIHNSLVGYRQDHHTWLLICISSPLTQQDKSLSPFTAGFEKNQP